MPSVKLLRVYVDADVLFRAAAASHEHTAALVLLRMSEFTLWDAVTARYTVEEAVRSLQAYLPESVPLLLQLIAHSLRTVDDPPASLLFTYRTQAHWKDVINLAAAVHAGAHVLATYNVRDYYPPAAGIHVMTPGQLVAAARTALYRQWALPANQI